MAAARGIPSAVCPSYPFHARTAIESLIISIQLPDGAIFFLFSFLIEERLGTRASSVYDHNSPNFC